MRNFEEEAMTNEEFASTISMLRRAQPFRPYAVEMNDGSRFEIDLPLALGYRDGSFGFMTEGRGPRFFNVADVRRIETNVTQTAAA
jgi:hypothetical protein